MPGPSIDLEKPNILGGLDKLATHFGLAIIAVFPTFLTCIIRPWRLWPLIDKDEPDGRKGILLSPGAFFFFALLVSFILAAILATPETLDYNGSYIGPDLAVAVQTAASDGDVWKLVATIMPMYGSAIVLGVLGFVLRPLVGPDWTLRVSLRAAFYVMGTLISWLLLVTTVADLVRLRTENDGMPSIIYGVSLLPTVAATIWIYAGIMRGSGAVSKAKSFILGLAMFGLVLTLMMGIDLLIRMSSG